MYHKKPKLPKGIRFYKGDGDHKYKAVFTDPSTEKNRTVQFGHRDYEHYKDWVPKAKGGQLWAHKNHGDRERRRSYRARHGALQCADGKLCISKKYSPAWFSYHFLW